MKTRTIITITHEVSGYFSTACKTVLSRLIIAIVLTTASFTTVYAASDEIVLVVNPQIKEQQISQSTVRTIFGMRLFSWKEYNIKVFVLPDDNPVHNMFTKQVLGMFPHQLRWAIAHALNGLGDLFRGRESRQADELVGVEIAHRLCFLT